MVVLDPNMHTIAGSLHPWSFELLVGRVSATTSFPRDKAEPRSSANHRGAERGAGEATAERPAGALGGENAPGFGRVHRHAVQKNLHVEARKRFDPVR